MPDLFVAAPLRRIAVASAITPAVAQAQVLHVTPAAILQPQLVAAAVAAQAVPMNKIAVRFDRKLDPNFVRVLDARLADRIGALQPRPGNGVRREEIGLPIAPSEDLADTLVYEGAADGKRYALPGYKLAMRDDGAVRRLAIRLEPATPEIWTLRVELDTYRAPPLAADATLETLPHDLILRLVYNVTLAGGGGGTRKELVFEVTRRPDGGATGVLQFATITERDQVRAAIGSITGGAGILVTRVIRVGVRIPPDPRALQRFMLYRPVTRGLDQTADPNPLFIDPASRHPLFNGLGNAGREPGLAERQSRWGDTFASYWQDMADPSLFYYLPDEFLLARAATGPRLPLLGVSAVDGTGSDEVTLSLEFMATPSVSSRRLAAARRELATFFRVLQDGSTANVDSALTAGSELDASIARLRFEPLVPQRARLFLALPRAGAAAAAVERPDVSVDVRLGFYVAERFSVDDFRAVYDALCGGSIALLRGRVDMEFGGNFTTSVPFAARFDRCNGDVLAAVAQPAADRMHWACIARNAIESPILLDYANVDASLGGQHAQLGASGTVALLPEGTTSFELVTATPVADPATVDLDLAGITVQTDPTVLWNALIEDEALPPYKRTIDVEILPSLFEARPQDPAYVPVELLIVDFANGQSARLTASETRISVVLKQRLADVILPGAASTDYRYRCRVVRRNNQVTTGDMHSASESLLVPDLTGLA